MNTIQTLSVWPFGVSTGKHAETRIGTGALRARRRGAVRARGFTLVELLVVITILAALVGLGLQRFGALREAAIAEKNKTQAALLTRTYEHWQSAGGSITAGSITNAATGNEAARAFLALMQTAPTGAPTSATVGTITMSDNTSIARQVRLKASPEIVALSAVTNSATITMAADGQFTIASTYTP